MAHVAKVLAVAIQLGFLVLVIHEFRLESTALVHICVLAFLGFLVHSFLPQAYRLPFFLLLSLAGIAIVFGLSNGAWLVTIGCLLIGLCHLPVAFSIRLLMLLVAGFSLAVLRLDWIDVPWSGAIWPILGSMFMFRLIIYLYDLQYEKTPTTVWRTFSYFFLLPNVCFPLFPVVDYKTFRRTYYDSDSCAIYQRGIQWMLRGVTHLILYRLVYHQLTIAPSEVTNAVDLVRFLLTNYLLYLRVSGQFHLIIGMLLLFGFNLPETHHRFFLASSFNDFWRRINIYWKDFMTKIFYYPAFLRLRKWGATSAFVVSTLFVFFATWLLHSYQWFWLRGTFPLHWQDVLFWGILALLVVWNSLHESKHGRERSLGARSRSFPGSALLVLRTVGCFTFICVLWSLWTSNSLSQWFSLWSFAGELRKEDLSWLPILFVAVVTYQGMALNRPTGHSAGTKRQRETTFQRSAMITGLVLLLVYLIGNPVVYSRLGSKVTNLIHPLRSDNLNKQEDALLERGYYENLQSVERFNSQLWEVYVKQKQPSDWRNLKQQEANRPTGDFLHEQLVPLSEAHFKGAAFHTNRWGMRDKDYDKNKPPSTYRIALLGASQVMGSGVADDETFECLLEDRLNSENKSGPYARYEILNFAVAGYSVLQSVMVLEKKVLSFEPDAVFYANHPSIDTRAIHHLARATRSRIDIPYDYLRGVVQRAGIDEETAEVIAEKKLGPFGAEMVSWAYRRIVDDCRKRGVLPVWIFLPRVREDREAGEIDHLIRQAEEAGFVVLNLSGAYANHHPKSLQVAEWDSHPNAKGHRLIADRLYKALREKEQMISLNVFTSDRKFAPGGELRRHNNWRKDNDGANNQQREGVHP